MLIDYAGGVKFIARQRGLEVTTDQPEKDGGENSAMTPTELFIAALGSCAGYYAVTFAKRHEIALEGLRIEVDHTYAEHPRRVGSVQIRLRLARPVDEQLRLGMLRAAEQCLVHATLRQPPEVTISVT